MTRSNFWMFAASARFLNSAVHVRHTRGLSISPVRIASKLCLVLLASVVLWAGCGRNQEPGKLSGHIFIRVGEKSGAGGHDFAQFLSDWTKLLKERGVLVEGGSKFPSKAQL